MPLQSYNSFLIWLLKRAAKVARFVQIDFANSAETKHLRIRKIRGTKNMTKQIVLKGPINYLFPHWFSHVSFRYWLIGLSICLFDDERSLDGQRGFGKMNALCVRQTNKNKWQIMTLQQFRKIISISN